MLGRTPRRNRSRARRSPILSTIWMLTPWGTAHPKPGGAVHGRHDPPGLDLLIRVDRVQQTLELAVPAGRSANANLGQSLGRRAGRLLVLSHRHTPATALLGRRRALGAAAAQSVQTPPAGSAARREAGGRAPRPTQSGPRSPSPGGRPAAPG